MVKLMETKSLWTGLSLRVKVALGVAAEAEVALEAEVVAEEAEEDLVAEAGEVLEVRITGDITCAVILHQSSLITGEGRAPGGLAPAL